MNISEQPVPDEIMASINGCAADGRQMLGLSEGADPATLVSAIDDFAYRCQKGDRPPPEVIEDADLARLVLGSLWGEQLVKQFHWEWAQATFHDHGDSTAFGVFSPDRSLAVYPLEFMLGCLQNPDVDVTVMLSFNMLSEGKIPKMKAKSYTNLMDGVKRIVPRG